MVDRRLSGKTSVDDDDDVMGFTKKEYNINKLYVKYYYDE